MIAQDIMRGTLLPAFRDGRMSQGIREGTQDIIDAYIALPDQRGEALQPPQKSLLSAPKFHRPSASGRADHGADRAPYLAPQPLPAMPQARLHDLAQPPPRDAARWRLPGRCDDVTRTCRHCGWSDTRSRANAATPSGMTATAPDPQHAPIRNSAPDGGRSSGFGGGSSRGGGASGRW
jgi:uncharacterized protein